MPATRPADVVAGQILTDACRYYEFRVVELDDREERTSIVVETVAQGRLRDFFGFNRAKHAVVEAAILATRTAWLPLDEMLVEFRKLAVLVDKTGGPRERAAFTLLHRHVRETAVATRSRPGPESIAAMTSLRIRIRTPSRLHFGLLGWGPQRTPPVRRRRPHDRRARDRARRSSRHRIVDRRGPARDRGSSSSSPSSERRMRRSRNDLATGPDPRRECARRACRTGRRDSALPGRRPRGPQAGRPDRDCRSSDLARLTGRGRRSGIGLHGFHHGGLIVDGGRRTEADIPPLLARLPFPEDWSILIVQPPGQRGLHGPDESRAFANLPPIAQDVTDSLCRLVLLEILPAVIERDLAAFGAALGELQATVGACFASAQGGIYATSQASRIVDELKSPRVCRRRPELLGTNSLRFLVVLR